MRGIQVVTSEGPAGPAYIRFSSERVASTEPTEAEDDVVVDYDASGGVVGVELVSLGLEVFAALLDVARQHDLDLSALLSRPFAVPPAA
jgi:uncharacterized protein YuzE